MLEQDLELSVRTRRAAYVVDPLLALGSPYGAQLASRLSAFADIWVTRTFWQVIDASDYYRNDPLALWPVAMREGLPAETADAFRQALALWEEVRLRTDLSHCRLHWVSDNLGESAFPDATPSDLIERYEALHQALTARSDPNDEATESAAFFGTVDSLSLAAALGHARVLTLAPDAPEACLRLACAQVGLELREPPAAVARLTASERRRHRELIVNAGCAPLLWGGLQIAVVHPLLRSERMLRVDAPEFEAGMGAALDLGDDFTGDGSDRAAPAIAVDPWAAACGFWHGL